MSKAFGYKISYELHWSEKTEKIYLLVKLEEEFGEWNLTHRLTVTALSDLIKKSCDTVER